MVGATRYVNVTAILSNVLQSKDTNDLAHIAAKIARQNFDWRFITTVFFNSTLTLGVETFLKLYENVVTIAKGTHYPKTVKKSRQYVLFGSDLTNIVHVFKWMQAHEFDNTGKYIVICLSVTSNECDVNIAIKILWEYKITNLIFLVRTEQGAAAFTYFPLSNSSCVYDDPVPIVNLTSCMDAINFDNSCNFYPLKLSNFNGCSLIVSTFLQVPYMFINDGIPSGTDGDLLRLIANKLNASLTVMTPRIGNGWGKMEKDGTWSGSLADVYNDFANFSMTSSALTLSRFANFHLSSEYNTAYVVWITHSPHKIPSSLKLSYPFQKEARIALVISFAFVVLCLPVLRSKFCIKICRELAVGRPRSVIFYSWMICMGHGVSDSRLPKKRALLHIVILWMWYCMLVRTFYQVSLISAMKTTYYYDEFTSIDDAIEEEYSIGGGLALKDYYIDYPPVYNKWVEIETPDIIPTLRNVSEGTEFVLAMSLLTARTIIWKEKIKVHILPEKVVTTPSVVFFKKYSPLAEAVNVVLDRLHESGFSVKYFKDYAPEVIHKNDDSPESIKLKHYTGCYAVLIIGFITSFVIFVVELLYVKMFGAVIIDFKN